MSGEDQFPSVGYWPLGAPSLRLAARGANPDDGFTAYQRGPGRWGDYSAADDDEYGALWFAAEYTNTLPRPNAANSPSAIHAAMHLSQVRHVYSNIKSRNVLICLKRASNQLQCLRHWREGSCHHLRRNCYDNVMAGADISVLRITNDAVESDPNAAVFQIKCMAAEILRRRRDR